MAAVVDLTLCDEIFDVTVSFYLPLHVFILETSHWDVVSIHMQLPPLYLQTRHALTVFSFSDLEVFRFVAMIITFGPSSSAAPVASVFLQFSSSSVFRLLPQ